MGLGDYVRLARWALLGRRPGVLPAPGSVAPAFAVPDESGTVRTLEEFRGRTLVLWFYPKADTPG